MTNISIVKFTYGMGTADPLWQWDYGQILQFPDLDLPEAYEVHFSNQRDIGTAKTAIGNADGVLIPDEYLTTGEDLHVWIFLHAGLEDGESEYYTRIKVKRRPESTNEQPTPEEQSVITQAIAALNKAVEETAADAAAADASAQASAQSASESAQSASDAAASAQSADESAQAASESETNAASSAQSASASALAAAQSATEAKDSEDAAERSAELAEQAAAKSGYLHFEIIDGDLIMTRTPNTQVTFYLDDGDLYLKEAV